MAQWDYSEDNLKKAVAAVKSEELSLREAEHKFDVPRATIFKKIKESKEKVRRVLAAQHLVGRL